MADEDGIEAFQVGEDDELFEWGVVADVALGIGVGIAPLFGGLAEEGDVEEVGFVRIDEGCLGLGDGGWEECFFDGIGVDAVVDLGEGALEVPIQLEAVVFLVLEALEFFDELELEFDGNPGGEFEGDILVGIGAAVSTGT